MEQSMAESVRVQLYRVGDRAAADRCLDAMERASGLRGEPNSDGRVYVIEARDIFAAHDLVIDYLPSGWQDHISFGL